MRSNTILNAIVKTAAVAGVLLASGVSHAADVHVYLQTEAYSKDILKYAPDYDPMTELPTPDVLESVPMWRFVCDPDVVPAPPGDPDPNPNCEAIESGSAQINATAADTLIIHLDNTLLTPVSILIPGPAGGRDPVA